MKHQEDHDKGHLDHAKIKAKKIVEKAKEHAKVNQMVAEEAKIKNAETQKAKEKAIADGEAAEKKSLEAIDKKAKEEEEKSEEADKKNQESAAKNDEDANVKHVSNAKAIQGLKTQLKGMKSIVADLAASAKSKASEAAAA